MLLKLKVRKEEKKLTLRKKCPKGATKKYIDKIHHHDMFELEACLKNCAQIDNELRHTTITSSRK